MTKRLKVSFTADEVVALSEILTGTTQVDTHTMLLALDGIDRIRKAADASRPASSQAHK